MPRFDRKNYSIPICRELQITQYDRPSAGNGYVDFEFEGAIAAFASPRHLEEDVGKNFHFERKVAWIQPRRRTVDNRFPSPNEPARHD